MMSSRGYSSRSGKITSDMLWNVPIGRWAAARWQADLSGVVLAVRPGPASAVP